jgi:SAM-dependent methyltransferase
MADELQIFKALSQVLHREWLRIHDDEGHGILSFPPHEIDLVARAIFSNLSQGGFATLVVSGIRTWDPQSYYFEAARIAARRGCDITRAFLLPHKQYMNDEVLQRHWKLDIDAGMKVKFLYVGDLLISTLLTLPSTLDFGFWDEQIVCTSVSNQGISDSAVAEWRISSRPEDIELAKSLRDELLEKGTLLTPPGESLKYLDLEEPMVRTAPLMDLLSGAICDGDYVSGEDCSWYHGAWQYLRIFDLVSTPTWHPNFYIPQLQLAAENYDTPKILISGTADYSVLAHILWAYDSYNKKCDVTVLDLCQTPLILCQWYAKQSGHLLTTVKADILLYDFGQLFDIIVTDAFLTRFPRSERIKVIKRWYDLLAPKGRVITTVRISGANSPDKTVARPDQVDSFRSRAFQQASRWQDFIPISPDTIAVKAQRYAERMTSYSARSVDEIRDEFKEVGFDILFFETVQVKGEMLPTTYLELTAVKP